MFYYSLKHLLVGVVLGCFSKQAFSAYFSKATSDMHSGLIGHLQCNVVRNGQMTDGVKKRHKN